MMRPAFNFEPKYRVTMLTREDWTKGTGAPPVIKGLIWFTDGSRMKGGYQGWRLWAICRRRAQLLPGQACNSCPGRDICHLGLYL